jgi:ribosomal protein S13
MARIAGVDLPREKKLEIGLTYIFGIGRQTARKILQTTGVSADQRVRDLSDAGLFSGFGRQSSAIIAWRVLFAPRRR